MSNLSGALVGRTLRRVHWPPSAALSAEVLAIGALLAVAFMLRAYDLGVPSLWMDEAITAEAAKGVLEHGLPILPSEQSYTRGLLNTYIVAASFQLFGVSELAGRLPSLLFGTATVFLVYLLGSALGGRRVGLIAAVVVALTDWDIAMSRQARMYVQLEFFFWASLLAAHHFLRDLTWRRGLVLALLTVAAMLSHEFAFFLPVLFVVLYLLDPSSIATRRRAVIAVLAVVPALVAMALTLFLLHGLDIARDVLTGPANYSGQYLLVLREELGPALPLAVAGAAVLFFTRWRVGLFLTVAVLLPFYLLSVHVFLFASRYLHFLMPAYALLVAFALDYVAYAYQRFVSPASANPSGRTAMPANALVALLLVLVLVASEQFTLAPKTHYDLGFHAPQPAFKEAAGALRTSIGTGDVVVAAWTPLAHFYLGRVDYWFAFDVLGIGADENVNAETGREVYTGALPLKNRAELEAVHLRFPRGWVVLDRTVWTAMDPADRDFLDDALTRVRGEPFGKMMVWSWDTGL